MDTSCFVVVFSSFLFLFLAGFFSPVTGTVSGFKDADTYKRQKEAAAALNSPI